MEVIVPPDIVALAIAYLTAQSVVTALLAAPTDISGKLPNPRPARHIQITRIDGGYRRARPARTDGAVLDINCRAANDIDADLLTRTTRAALVAAGGWSNGDGVIVRVADMGGPHDIPDSNETTPTPRQVFTVKIEAHP